MPVTQKERVIAQINHIETDRVPYHLTFDPGSQIEERLDVYYGNDAGAAKLTMQFSNCRSPVWR